MLIPAAAAGAAGAGGTPGAATDVTISPSVGVSGVTEFTAEPVGGPASTYQWYDNATPISGATSSTYTSDGTFGTTLLHCKINGGAVTSSTPAVMLYVGQVARTNSNTGTLTVPAFTVMNGQKFYVVLMGYPDDFTPGITGQTLTQFHDDALGTGNRHIWWGIMTGFTGSTFDLTWTPTTHDRIGISVWQAVGFGDVEAEAEAGIQNSNNQTPTVLTTTASDGLTLVKAIRYDGILGVTTDGTGPNHSEGHVLNLADEGPLVITAERGADSSASKFASLVRIAVDT